MPSRVAAVVGAALFACGCGGDETTAARTTHGATTSNDAGSCPGGMEVPGTGCIAAGVPADGCAEGFEAEDGGCSVVLPPSPCGDGTMAIPGEVECHELAACGDGPWGDAPVAATTQFVDASYTGGGSDGSEQHPWTTIQEALDAAADSAVVAVAEGSYHENLWTLGKSVRVWGRCPALVHIVGVAANAPAVQLTEGGAPELHSVSVTGPFVGVFVSGTEGVVVERVRVHDTGFYGLVGAVQFGPTSLAVRDVLVERATGLGIGADGVTMSVERSVVRDIGEKGPAGGEGILVQQGGSLTVTRSVVLATYRGGIHAVGSTAVVDGVFVRDVKPDTKSGRSGFAVAGFTVDAAARSQLTVTGSVFELFSEGAVLAATSDLVVERTVARDARGAPTAGIGVAAVDESTVTLRDCLLERCRDSALVIRGSDGDVEGLATRDSQGFGALVYRQGTMALRRSTFETASAAGVYVFGSTGSAEDVVVRGARPDPANGLYGDGIAVGTFEGAKGSATLARVRVEGSARAGISVFGSVATLSDVDLQCNPVDLDAETDGDAATFEEAGPVTCGCAPDADECRVESSMLPPPAVAQ